MSVPFKVGDRVKMTAEGLRNFMPRIAFETVRTTTPEQMVCGSVVSVFPDREQIKVKRGDVKVNETWHWKFWELA